MSGDTTITLCRHVCARCGGCDICCLGCPTDQGDDE